MVSKQQTIIITKIPNKTKLVDYPQVFPRYEQLYLELIEDKTKIKQHLVNKDYQPSPEDFTSPRTSFSVPQTSKQPDRNDDVLSIKSDETNLSDDSSVGSDRSERSERSEPSDKSIPDQKEKNIFSTSGKKDSDSYSVKSDSSDSSLSSVRTKHSNQVLTDKLQNLLTKKDGSNNTNYKDKYSQERNSFDDYQKSRSRLPTLSELEKQGVTNVNRELADANRIDMEDEDLKREMLFKFDLLRKSYKDHPIPTFTIHSDLSLMAKSYDDTVRRLSLDNSVENYKKYLIGAFMVIEYGLGRFLKLDMKGYTQQQIVQMSTYEKLLIELGEKSYVPSGKDWSIEVRLVFLVIIQTAFFIVGKMIFNNTGSNIMNAINNMNTASSKPAEQPKKKMQGPNINLDDLPDVTEL